MQSVTGSTYDRPHPHAVPARARAPGLGHLGPVPKAQQLNLAPLAARAAGGGTLAPYHPVPAHAHARPITSMGAHAHARH